ncbi:hypothetical protein OAI07_01405 [Akkermansiaceae bacterium]|nr:hypothetical protein [Akkermansiaceae bacterium]
MPYQIIVDTPDKLTGLTDVIFSVFDSAGTEVTGSPFAAVELGAKGVYTASWTPLTGGDFIIEVSSISEGISDVSGSVSIELVSNATLQADIAALQNLSASDVWDAASRTLTDKEGYSLDSAEYTAIADAVQAAIINEGDGQAVIDAIVAAIGNANIDELVLVSAIRADLEREGGILNQILDASSSSNIKFRIIN